MQINTGSGMEELPTGQQELNIRRHYQNSVKLSFSLRYLTQFNRAASLSCNVKLMLAKDTPLIVQYDIEQYGCLKFYLAPKIEGLENQP